MRRCLILIASVFLAFASCTDNSLTVHTKTLSVVLDASMPELQADDETKAQLDYVVRLTWTAGNTIEAYKLSDNMTPCGSLVASATGTNVAFTGSLEDVSVGDNILFVYSTLSSSFDEENNELVLDFSSQGITDSAKSVPFVTVATLTLTDEHFSGSSVQISPAFTLPFAFYMLSLGSIPASTNIVEVDLTGFSYTLSLSSSNGTLVKTVGPEPLIDTEDDGTKYFEECITLTPPESTTVSTYSSGTFPLYMTLPAIAKDELLEKKMIVILGDDENSVQYETTFVKTFSIKEQRHYRSIFTNWTCLDSNEKEISLSVDVEHPSVVATSSLPSTWAQNTAISVVNLTTKELLGGELIAQGSGTTVTFSGDDLSTFKGVHSGDELLLIYPAIPENNNASDFDEGGFLYGLSEQDGSVVEGVLVGTTIVTSFSQSRPAEMNYITATIGVTLEDTNNEIPDGGTLSKFRLYDMDGAVPSAFVFAYDENKGYSITVEAGDEIIADSVEDNKAYFRIPATEAVDFTGYVDAYYSSSEFCYSEENDNFIHSLSCGEYRDYTLTVAGVGEDEPEEGDGPVED